MEMIKKILETGNVRKSLLEDEVKSDDIYVVDERPVGKVVIIMMQDPKDSTMRSVTFRKGEEKKYNRNNQDDINKLWQLALDSPSATYVQGDPK